ncbi:hypothetical protein LOD99_10389 [Oopsacas minuta]|uniref:Transposase n=1 Tax=Oopsacas minuta TaxID=111878 RepID=A0AAV7KH06_9METZ|nr:hypothetical protein LOD99_10389 [Oopsacas minuta]
MPRSGRPKSITTPRMKKLVRDRIRRNPLRSMRKMAAEVHISKGSMQNLVKNELDFRSYKRKTVHFLSETIKLKRLSRSKGLLTRLEIENLDRFLFSDEKLFSIEQATNKQNDTILAPNSSSIPEDVLYVARTQKPRSIMVWTGISANGRTPLIFIPEGVKINAATYRQLILEPVIKHSSRNIFRNQPFVFQQDGAPAHTANITQKWLHENISGFLSKEEWPPSSPDLNPMDFSIWAILGAKACAKSHNNLDSLKRSLAKEWEKIPQEVLRAAVESFPTRLRSVVKNKGGYIE